MRTATFAVLAVVTVGAVAGAYFAIQERNATIATPHEQQALYPDLLSRVNDVTELRIESQSNGSLTMQQTPEAWVLAEKHNYPVDFDKISQSLVELASLSTEEPKTRRPENFAELGVEDVRPGDGEASTGSIRVTARAGQETLADLLVGRTRPEDIGGGVFVRMADENQVWLAGGSYQPKREALQWLDRNIVNIDSRRIRRVEIEHADGEATAVEKPELASEDMAYAASVPEELEPKPAHEMNALASILDFLILQDVRPADELDWSTVDATGRYITYDGLQIAVDALKTDGNTWFRLRAEPSSIEPQLAEFVAEHAGQDSAEGRMADEMKSAEEVADEIAAINARVSPWAYRFTDYKTGKAMSRPDDLLQEPAPDSSERDNAPAAAAGSR